MQVDDDARLWREVLVCQFLQNFAPLRAAANPHIQHRFFRLIRRVFIHNQPDGIVILVEGREEVFHRHAHALEEVRRGDFHLCFRRVHDDVVHRQRALLNGRNVRAEVGLRVVHVAERARDAVNILREEAHLVDDLAIVALHRGCFVGDGSQQVGAFLQAVDKMQQLIGQPRHRAVEVVFVVVVRVSARDFDDFAVNLAEIRGVRLRARHDFANRPQLHGHRQRVRALRQVEEVRFAVRAVQRLGIPLVAVREGVQPQLVEGNFAVHHNLPIGGHPRVVVLLHLQGDGVQPVLRHVEIPRDRRIPQPPAPAAHHIQHAVRAGTRLGHRVGIGFAADDVLTAPRAVFRLKLDLHVLVRRFQSLRRVARRRFRVSRMNRRGDQRQRAQCHRLVYIM